MLAQIIISMLTYIQGNVSTDYYINANKYTSNGSTDYYINANIYTSNVSTDYYINANT